MSTATLDIAGLCRWSAPKRVETARGPRELLTAEPSEPFWQLWRRAKDELKSAGLGVGKDRDGRWEVCWWRPLSEAEQAATAAAVAASRAATSDFMPPAPDGLSYLPFQRAGIVYAKDRPATLFADEMGLGKTIQAIGTWNCDDTIRKTLVVCPATLRLNWRREFERWAVRPVRVLVVNGGKPADFPAYADFDVLVVNYDVVAKHRVRLDAFAWDLLIVDEVHFAKNPKAARTKAIFGDYDRKGNRTAEPIRARRKLFLSGTLIVNRPLEAWTVVRELDPTGLGKSFFGFAKRYTDAHQTGTAGISPARAGWTSCNGCCASGSWYGGSRRRS